MGLSTAERNRRKRERKKRAKEEERKRLEEEKKAAQRDSDEAIESQAGTDKDNVEIEIEYVTEPLFTPEEEAKGSTKSETETETGNGVEEDDSISAVLRRFHARAFTALVSDDEKDVTGSDQQGEEKKEAQEDELGEDENSISKRKLRELSRPTIAQLKNRVERADLVEAHDVTSRDPDFLLFLKAIESTVPVPRHWGRKRKYLQGKVRFHFVRFLSPLIFGICVVSYVRTKIGINDDSEELKSRHSNYQTSSQKPVYLKYAMQSMKTKGE